MYPERLPDGIDSDAERRLFDRFKREFSDDFTIFHSVAWLSRIRGGRARDGEIDFLIAHPRHGLLVAEVKGGGIEFDAPTRSWFSLDRSGQRHLIRDPVSQVRTSRYVLQEMLSQAPATAGVHYPSGYTVVFPDTRFTPEVGIAVPREIVIDLPRARDLKQAIIDVYGYFASDLPQPGPSGIDALVRVLGRSWRLPPMIGAAIDASELRLRELTEQQYAILDALARRPRALISGGAGTGKTMLALEKARRLARSGFRTLLTCFNANLAAWMGAQLRGTGVHVRNFHGLCTEMAQRGGNPLVRQPQETEQQFYDRFPDALLESIPRLEQRFDAIVVDEGQDFREEWWIALCELLADPREGVLYIFYDDNQRIYQRKSTFPLSDEPFALTQNCRNTVRIHDLVKLFYQGDVDLTCSGPLGDPIVLLKLEDGESERDAVLKHVEWLLAQQVRPQDLVILTPRRQALSELKQGVYGHVGLTWDPASSSGRVLCSTVHAFKGLERPAVIVAELTGVTPVHRAELLYVAFSRARHHLAVCGLDLDAVADFHVSRQR